METFISLNEEKVPATTYLKVVDLQYELRQPDQILSSKSKALVINSASEV